MTPARPLAFLQCIECQTEFAIDERLYTCPRCGGLLDVQYSFNLRSDVAAIKSLFRSRRTSLLPQDLSGVWRFRELLPFATGPVVTLQEGNTPVYDAPRSAAYAGMDRLQFKHQGMNPTGSFKDNGMTTGVTQAVALGARAVACASTGNTSASMAAYAARAGLRALVFVPAGQVAIGKLSQALEYQASVIEIEGNFDDAMRIVRELAEETELYLLNSINPFRLEGQKTIVIEMMEQLDWEPPDWIVLPGGNLGSTSAFGKALHELADVGLIAKMPRLAVIQAHGADPFYRMMASTDHDKLVPINEPATLATAIRIGQPVSWKKALRALAWTNGIVEEVTEQEIADAKATIGSDGIGCEPASAATLAGVRKLVAAGVIRSTDQAVCVLTGNLLKDSTYTVDYHSGTLFLKASGASDRVEIKGTFSNRPIRVRASKDEIKQKLDLS